MLEHRPKALVNLRSAVRTPGPAAALVAACSTASPGPARNPPEVPAARAPELPPGPRTLPAPPVSARLLLDAGHGAPGNSGNLGMHGQIEAEEMRALALALAPALEGHGLSLRLTRPEAALVDYDQRLALCEGQELLLSLHSDSRAGTRSWWVDEARGLWANEGAAGYAVLYSDEGPAPLVAQRHRWAQALGLRMAEAGLQPYLGLDYTALYGADEVPGVFVDRHAPSKRIRLLRRPSIPSLIVETHEAHDAADVALWQRPETRSAFASAVALSIADLQAAP